jgi:hypothetical protein
MPQLQRINLDFNAAENELADFKKFLDNNPEFSETAVVSLLKTKINLCCLLGSMAAGVPRSDVYKFEFQIQGVFRADFVAGHLQQQRFVLVEFEDGTKNSLFGPGETNQMRDRSNRFERGFGQLVDWAWARADAGNTQIFQNAFECNDMYPIFVLICGRDAFMGVTERKRFVWRNSNVGLGGAEVACLTYDGLFQFFQGTVEAIKSYQHSSAQTGAPLS